MNKLILYCKSFNRDVQRCKILLESIEKHNKENIPFYISVPKEDINLFKNTLGEGKYILVTDEEILSIKLSESWKNQQVVKMSLNNLKITENYVVLDSDSYFIRDFYYQDFLAYDNIPYTVMHEQKDLFEWTSKYCTTLGFDPQISFAECRTPIMSLFERPGRLYDFGPVPVIWSTKVWDVLANQYAFPHALTFVDLIEAISSEFTWYGEALLTWKPIELWPIEPIFKVFHYLPQYHQFKNLNYTEEHLSRNYLGIVMQSSSGLPIKY